MLLVNFFKFLILKPQKKIKKPTEKVIYLKFTLFLPLEAIFNSFRGCFEQSKILFRNMRKLNPNSRVGDLSGWRGHL